MATYSTPFVCIMNYELNNRGRRPHNQARNVPNSNTNWRDGREEKCTKFIEYEDLSRQHFISVSPQWYSFIVWFHYAEAKKKKLHISNQIRSMWDVSSNYCTDRSTFLLLYLKLLFYCHNLHTSNRLKWLRNQAMTHRIDSGCMRKSLQLLLYAEWQSVTHLLWQNRNLDYF